jgi:hypothetical protein
MKELLLLVPIFSQLFLSLMGGNLLALALFSTGHNGSPYDRCRIMPPMRL